MLIRFGPAAKPATPILLALLRDYEPAAHNGSTLEALKYLKTLQSIGEAASSVGAAPSVGASLIELLDSDSRLLAQTPDENRAEIHAALINTMSATGLPRDVVNREKALEQFISAVQSEETPLFIAATRALRGAAVGRTRMHQARPALLRALDPDYQGLTETYGKGAKVLSWQARLEAIQTLAVWGEAVGDVDSLLPRLERIASGEQIKAWRTPQVETSRGMMSGQNDEWSALQTAAQAALKIIYPAGVYPAGANWPT